MEQVSLDDELLARAREAARQEGFETVEAFIAAAVAERVERPQRSDFLEATRRIRERMLLAGVTEEQVVGEFEQFRENKWRAQKG